VFNLPFSKVIIATEYFRDDRNIDFHIVFVFPAGYEIFFANTAVLKRRQENRIV